MGYSEYLFRSDTLNEQRAQALIEKRARALSEWFVMASNGSKMSYREYLGHAGLIEDENVSETEYQEAAKAAFEMYKAVNGKK
jgi:hypothetical protein